MKVDDDIKQQANRFFSFWLQLNLLFMFFLWIAVQAASRCYQCASGQGWTDCAAKQAFTSCPDDSDNCGQYIVTITNPNTLQYSTSYGKGCFSSISCQNPQTSQECNAFRAKHANFLVNCQGSCCATNDCNGPVLPGTNYFIFNRQGNFLKTRLGKSSKKKTHHSPYLFGFLTVFIETPRNSPIHPFV